MKMHPGHLTDSFRLSAGLAAFIFLVSVAARAQSAPTAAAPAPTDQTTVSTAEPVALARLYEAGGAAAMSVLTEPEHFI